LEQLRRVLNTEGDGLPSITESVRRTFSREPNLYHVRQWKSYAWDLEQDERREASEPVRVGEAAPDRSKARSWGPCVPGGDRVGGDQIHTEHEDHPWTRKIPDHPPRADSSMYVKSRERMNELADEISPFFYGSPSYEDHHGGGLWLKDDDGWFLIRNVAGIEWGAQFCADPAKVDRLRLNARRLYAGFPE